MSRPPPPSNPHVAAMSAYVPGEQPQGGGWVKLNTNENPYPPSQSALDAIRSAVGDDGASLRLYPSPDSSPLREAAAKVHGFPAERIVAGNGSDDLLNLLIRAYAGPGRAVGMLDPSYSLYPVLAAAQGAPVVRVSVAPDFSFDLDAATQCGASVFFLTNPNAPLGIRFTPERVSAFAERFPGLLVVDEAYAAFSDSDCVDLARSSTNVVVTRTLSKGHALAGLRAGYALCPAETASLLHRVRDSYNLDRLAQAAAAAALLDRAWFVRTVAAVKSTRRRMVGELAALGWSSLEPHGNFVLTEPRSVRHPPSRDASARAFEFLKARRILVRRFPGHPLTERCLRVSVGTDAEADTFLAAARAWTAEG
ncbi:MAG: histidinol-phosphate transaminase [Verrucomicrobiota bacterium]